MKVMTEVEISRRDRILIAAAAVAALGPRVRVREIKPVVHLAPRMPHEEVHIRTARRGKTHEIADLA